MPSTAWRVQFHFRCICTEPFLCIACNGDDFGLRSEFLCEVPLRSDHSQVLQASGSEIDTYIYIHYVLFYHTDPTVNIEIGVSKSDFIDPKRSPSSFSFSIRNKQRIDEIYTSMTKMGIGYLYLQICPLVPTVNDKGRRINSNAAMY
jgi:hypothetical protein